MSKCWYCNEELTSATYREEHIGICTNCYRSMFQGNKIVKGWMDKISDLEAKLAEKDKEIEKLTEELDDKNFCKDFVDLYTENKLKTQMLHENWKDKISFCIEQLEKVRSFAYDTFKEFGCFDETDLEHILDNQIEELKKGE